MVRLWAVELRRRPHSLLGRLAEDEALERVDTELLLVLQGVDHPWFRVVLHGRWWPVAWSVAWRGDGLVVIGVATFSLSLYGCASGR